MDIAYLAFLLFTFPGFCFIWSFRHFACRPKLGEFEYAAWSFLFGSIIFLIFGLLTIGTEIGNTVLDLSKPFELLSTSLGISLVAATFLSFPLGYMFAWIYYQGLFSWINKKLLKFIKK